MSHILTRYKELGQEFDIAELTLKKSIRINHKKIQPDILIAQLEEKGVRLEKIPETDFGYYYDAPFSIASTKEYLLGYIYPQEVASQLPVQVLLNQDYEVNLNSDQIIIYKETAKELRVLDMCAAPGSKTTQLAELVSENVVIVATEIQHQRLQALAHNIERMGCTNVVTYRKDAKYATDLNCKFDRILLDAPCSGNFCIEPNFVSMRTVSDFKNRAKEQKELFSEAWRLLVDGGILVYSTCSLEPEENELLIQWALDTFDTMELLETGLNIGDSGLTNVFGQVLDSRIAKTRRFWPHKTNTEGFFIAKVIKNPQK